MTRRLTVSLMLVVLHAGASAQASDPVFTASLVQGNGASRVAEPPRKTGIGLPPAADRGPGSPRQLTDELADLFSHVCVQHGGRVEPAEAWARERGFVVALKPGPRPPGAADAAPSMQKHLRQGDNPSGPAITLTQQPEGCSVWSHGVIDGPRLRRRAGEIAAATAGARQPVPPTESTRWGNGSLRVAVYPLGPNGQGGSVRTIGPETAASHGGAHMILIPPAP